MRARASLLPVVALSATMMAGPTGVEPSGVTEARRTQVVKAEAALVRIRERIERTRATIHALDAMRKEIFEEERRRQRGFGAGGERWI